MGPPIYIGGNRPQPTTLHLSTAGFNGATDLHRWKHAVNVQAVPAQRALQWGHRFTSVETKEKEKDHETSSGGFNGATDLHRWKQYVDLIQLKYKQASMGPPIYIGGNQLTMKQVYCSL